MKICLSICNKNLEKPQLSDHFGESGRFVIYDSQSGVVLPHASNVALCRGPCRCQLPSVGESAFDAVICRAIGARSFAMLRRSRVDVFITHAHDMQEAVNAWRAQQVKMASRSICRPEFLANRHSSVLKSRES